MIKRTWFRTWASVYLALLPVLYLGGLIYKVTQATAKGAISAFMREASFQLRPDLRDWIKAYKTGIEAIMKGERL